MYDGWCDSLQVAHSLGNVECDFHAERPGQCLVRDGLVLEQVVKVAVRDELHHHAKGIQRDSIELDQVWVVERTHDVHLMLELFEFVCNLPIALLTVRD